MGNQSLYAVLIIDLKRSKRYSAEYRSDIQSFIFSTIQCLNNIFYESLIKKVDFSAGDELQGLFTSPQAAFLYYRFFNLIISPIRIRAGIGVGTWDVVIDDAGTTAQDGVAYHRARYAIETTEREAFGYNILLNSGKSTDSLINSTINTSSIIIEKNSYRQNFIMLLTELMYPITCEDIVDLYKLDVIIYDLIQQKQDLLIERKPYSYMSTEKRPLEYNIGHIELIKPIDAYSYDNDFFINSAAQMRGFRTIIADVLNITRQGTYNSIRSSNLFEERNATITTLRMMNIFS